MFNSENFIESIQGCARLVILQQNNGNYLYINEENKSKEIQGKNVLSFTKFVLGGFCPGVFVGGFLS